MPQASSARKIPAGQPYREGQLYGRDLPQQPQQQAPQSMPNFGSAYPSWSAPAPTGAPSIGELPYQQPPVQKPVVQQGDLYPAQQAFYA